MPIALSGQWHRVRILTAVHKKFPLLRQHPAYRMTYRMHRDATQATGFEGMLTKVKQKTIGPRPKPSFLQTTQRTRYDIQDQGKERLLTDP
jgi:hypothetical protein